MQKYEIEHVCFIGHFIESEIAMLTGLNLDEILNVTKDIKIWKGSKFIEVFRNLGYNCNNRFTKFDKDTQYPCLMRSHNRYKKENYWYGFVYYDDHVYDINLGKLTWAEWNDRYPQLRVTTMLQVWI